MRTWTFACSSLLLVLLLACGETPPPYEEGLPEGPYTPEDVEAYDADAAPLPPLEVTQVDVVSDEPGSEPVDEPTEEGPPVEEPETDEEPPVEEPPTEEEPPMEEPPAEPEHLAPPADCPSVKVVNTGGVVLNVRPTPSTDQSPVGTLAPGAVATALAVVPGGEAIGGDTTWYEVAKGSLTGYIAGAFAQCVDPSAAPAFPESTFLLPLQCGKTATVTQGNNTSFSHSGYSKYAFDFGLPLNTPLVAMKRGTVIFRDASTQPGDPCYSGGGPSCIAEANLVVLQHDDGSDTSYAHVNSIPVSVGQVVERGQVVAYSGGTGYSTGPHAHVARQTHCGWSGCQSIPMAFGDVSGDGVPVGGEVVTSQNCP